MPFGPADKSSKNSVTLEVFGGTITAALDHDIPEGGSPRNQDVDFTVGSVATRAGLTSAFDFTTVSEGNPQTAVSQTPVLNPWVNPGNILLNLGGTYASFTPSNEAESQEITPAFVNDLTGGGTTPWTNVGNMTSPTAFATNSFSVTSFTDFVQLSGNMPSVPSNATITGVMITFSAQGSGINLSVNLNSGTNQVVGITGNGNYTLGSSTFLWGQSLTPANITSLGIFIQGHRFTGSASLGI